MKGKCLMCGCPLSGQKDFCSMTCFLQMPEHKREEIVMRMMKEELLGKDAK